MSKVYDPIGLVAPFTVGARLILKDIWRINGQSWDDELLKDTVDRFLAWGVEQPRLAEITIPKSYFSGPFKHLELHMFADSSQDVFSAVGFLRAQVTCTSGEITTELSFVLGKARVAHMKVTTVTKLELQAVLLAAGLKRENCRALTVTVDNVFMRTDSTIVLQWMNSTNKHPIFIANRVSEILEKTSVDQWNHVATCDNPADAGTRGMTAEVLQSSSWVRGPEFLRTKQFPYNPNTDVVDNIKLGVVTKEQDDYSISSLAASVTKPPKEQSVNLIPFDKFSSDQKLFLVTAYVIRLLPSHESYRTVNGSIADPVELEEAELHLQYLVQGGSFNTERKDLLGNKSVKRSSRILQFTPFIWPHGLIRSSGRLRRLVEIDFDTKHPIVLDACHTVVKLFLRHTHLKNHHQGIDYLQSEVQERYAILKLRSTLRSIKSNCVLCRKFRAATIQLITAELPKERLAYQSPPFTNTGVDYFGQFYVTVRRTTEKRW